MRHALAHGVRAEGAKPAAMRGGFGASMAHWVEDAATPAPRLGRLAQPHGHLPEGTVTNRLLSDWGLADWALVIPQNSVNKSAKFRKNP